MNGTITRAEFTRLLGDVFAPRAAADAWISIADDHASIKRFAGDPSPIRLEFAPPGSPRPAEEPPTPRSPRINPDRPLTGLHIAIDPGHLGGGWAKMEERSLEFAGGPSINEGDLTLAVAERLTPMLRALGARVSPIRFSSVPLTGRRPSDLRTLAARELRRRGRVADPEAVRRESERLFYRTSEIRARARYANRVLRPDLVLCLHFNAEAWRDPRNPLMLDVNHFHALVNGCYLPEELALDDVRHDMLIKLLNGSHAAEVAVAESISRAFEEATGLPPYQYRGEGAVRVGSGGYTWARNLIANRLYRCPVIFLEPYVMNNPTVAARLQAGDYEGERVFGGKSYPSIIREYARAVLDGLVRWRLGSSDAAG